MHDLFGHFIPNLIEPIVDPICEWALFPPLDSIARISHDGFCTKALDHDISFLHFSSDYVSYYMIAKSNCSSYIDSLSKKIPGSKACHPVNNFIRNKQEEIDTVFVFSHGNGSQMGCFLNFAVDILDDHPSSMVLLYEYIGYEEKHQIKPSEESIRESVLNISKVIIENDLYTHNIYSIGYSIGCFAALSLCERVQVDGVVLLAPFWSPCHCVGNLGRILSHVWSRYRNCDLIKLVHVPIVFLHGSLDNTVPCEHSKWLHDECPSLSKKLCVISGADHNSITRHIKTSLSLLAEVL